MNKLISQILISIFVLVSFNCKDEVAITPPPTGADTTSHNFQWSIDTIGTRGSILYGVWGVDPNNAYACGLVYWPNRQLPVDIIKWDGIKWNPVDHLDGILTDIHGFGPNDIWFVGAWFADTGAYALIVHWNGTSWFSWKLPQYNQLLSIWGTSSSNVYAVGWGGVILHYNGISWSVEQSGTTLNLRSISGSDESHIFIAGNKTNQAESILLERENTAWKLAASGIINPDSNSLYGDFESVWCSEANRVTLVGSLCYEGVPGQWKLSDIPFNSPGPNLTGLAGMSAVHGNKSNNVFVSGYYGLIIHWNGTNWHLYSQFFDKSKSSNLKSIWVSDKAVFVAGYEDSDNRGIVFRGKQ